MKGTVVDMQKSRYFNTEGICDPELHYMVKLDERLKDIRRLFVDRGKYFVINRARQYGKTTTLYALTEYLKEDYLVLFMDFQEIGSAEYKEEATFSEAFAGILLKALQNAEEDNKDDLVSLIVEFMEKTQAATLRGLFDQISKLCQKASKPVVMIIDEVDSAANNQVFLDFLALLRRYYIDRKNQSVFYSVILAGVYDIKNLKLKLRSDTEHRYNSPWNIAADFDIEMSFTSEQIASMLREYEADHCTGMNIEIIANEIYQYTSGYPYLVSVICKFLDEKIPGQMGFDHCMNVWTKEGVSEAVKLLLKKNIPLFDSMAKQLDRYKDLSKIIEEILYQGKQISFSPMEEAVNLGIMFGFMKEENGYVAVANRIFEMALLNLFIAKEAVRSESFRYGQRDKSQFIENGRLNMELVMEKFVEHFEELYGDNDEKFVEEYGRKFFLLYLKPIINGTGNYYLESQTRDAKRTDVIVDYLGEQFIIELKIWHGNEYNERGREQLTNYLDYYHLNQGYMLSFNFNKKKQTGVKKLRLENRIIVEAVV